MGTTPSRDEEDPPKIDVGAVERHSKIAPNSNNNKTLPKNNRKATSSRGRNSTTMNGPNGTSPGSTYSRKTRGSDHSSLAGNNRNSNGSGGSNISDAVPMEERAPSSVIDDSTVTVNLAMADLMAYLQVVANNSSNLPLTRRDDPELGRTVSNLTADEYAKKCSAFIPSDVRIICGSFTKHGPVWDLPTSEEFAPGDNTQEPGISHGGACSNAMLKVLYDMETENDKISQVDYTNAANLFDEDEDEENGNIPDDLSQSYSVQTDMKSFDSLALHDLSSPATITWAELLRKMKVEIQTIGYCQMPYITTSRKFDLSQSFSIVPPGFDRSKNKKRSLLIGCNYKGVPDTELKASHDDIRSVKDYIVNVHGFSETRGLMTVLLDDNRYRQPTHSNITEAFKALSEQSQPGDAVFIQFSGHGCRVLDAPIDADVESYDEGLIPSDYHTSGMIRDTLIFKTLLAPMRHGVTVTIVIDCCDTGMVLDLPYSWSTKNDRADIIPKMSLNDDFSFVRFLKVIKTLYESSTFTQLGKTVRSAIYDKAPMSPLEDDDNTLHDDESTFGGGSLVTMDENETVVDYDGKGSATSSFMKVLSACHSPKDISPRRLRENFTDNTDGIGKHNGSTHPADKVSSLFQQVLSCGLHNPAESDDDSYHRRGTYDTDDDYDSMTEDETLNARDYARQRGRVNDKRNRY